MKCEQIMEMLSPYIDGMTTEKENKAIVAHLESCSQCQTELENLRSFCAALQNLPTPELPEGFAEDLHKRLVEENSPLLRPRDIKKPKKQGWIAASVAGIALAAGIYASSFLPISPMIASWQDKHDKANNNNKPSVAINEIINRLYSGDQEKPGEKIQEKDENTQKDSQVAVNTGDKDTPKNSSQQQEPVKNNEEPAVVEKVTPKLADVLSTRISVKNAGESMDKVVQLAQSNGWEYAYNDNVPKAFSGPQTSGMALKVNQKDVDKVLSELGGIGKTTTPTHNSLELTQNYAEVEKKINLLQKEQKTLQQAGNNQEKLNEVEAQLQEYMKQRTKLDKEMEMVTLNIYFVQEVNP
jgi:hypothetical protein